MVPGTKSCRAHHRRSQDDPSADTGDDLTAIRARAGAGDQPGRTSFQRGPQPLTIGDRTGKWMSTRLVARNRITGRANLRHLRRGVIPTASAQPGCRGRSATRGGDRVRALPASVDDNRGNRAHLAWPNIGLATAPILPIYAAGARLGARGRRYGRHGDVSRPRDQAAISGWQGRPEHGLAFGLDGE